MIFQTLLTSLSQFYWSPWFWLPENVKWAQLNPQSDKRFANVSDVYAAIISAVSLLAIRFFLERIICKPIGTFLGITEAHKKLTKFSECGWRFVYYTVSATIGICVLWDKPGSGIRFPLMFGGTAGSALVLSRLSHYGFYGCEEEGFPVRQNLQLCTLPQNGYKSLRTLCPHLDCYTIGVVCCSALQHAVPSFNPNAIVSCLLCHRVCGYDPFWIHLYWTNLLWKIARQSSNDEVRDDRSSDEEDDDEGNGSEEKDD
ncbi:Ceramide synthase 2 [Orchesella cincta]|uniref:Ceramide synthase 2 n=1 Tax=Orchesella cincta TaxID=48709 RepID=A0A1D2MEA4_ORCCI|nr:Ceramide synthase 2 [Orchesella cincta]